MILLVLLASGAVAVVTYVVLERMGFSAAVPIVARATVWGALGLLLLNVGCPRERSGGDPVVILDASLSARSDSARFGALVDSASALGATPIFAGDPRPASDSSTRGRTLIGDAVTAALAGGRPVELWTDGEVEDWYRIPADAREGLTVAVFPRSVVPQLALPLLGGTARATRGDSAFVRGAIASYEGWQGDTVSLALRDGATVLARARVPLGPGASRRSFVMGLNTAALGPGEHLLEVSISEASAVPQAAVRWHRLEVVAAPGVVLVADPADWDARFLYRTLLEVAELPVRGYARLTDQGWYRLADLSPVAQSEVERFGRRAELVVAKGKVPGWLQASRARAVLRWPSGENGEALLEGDWYLSGGTDSPVAPYLAAMPLDSFPPVSSVTPVQPGEDDWVALSAQEGRRGALRPVVVGREGPRRTVTISADGLWRWAFSGGSSEQGYRTLVSELSGWLLGRPDSAAGQAAPLRYVVQQARPVSFRWRAGDPAAPLAITISSSDTNWVDTLAFDGDGLASLYLPLGSYRYQLAGGGGGLIAVEPYSDEWLPRPRISAGRAVVAVTAESGSARESLWLFGLIVVALATEWLWRRRKGLR